MMVHATPHASSVMGHQVAVTSGMMASVPRQQSSMAQRPHSLVPMKQVMLPHAGIQTEKCLIANQELSLPVPLIEDVSIQEHSTSSAYRECKYSGTLSTSSAYRGCKYSGTLPVQLIEDVSIQELSTSSAYRGCKYS